MDLQPSLSIKSYNNQGLDYFHLTQASPCLNVIATPLAGDSTLDLSIVDFGPMVIIKRTNHGAAIEQYQFPEHVIAIQLPTSDYVNIDAFQTLLGGFSHSPFLTSGAKAQWIVPSNLPLYQLHLDKRWLEKVLGAQIMEDYLELTQAFSRRAYDRQVLFSVACACEYALNEGIKQQADSGQISAAKLESLITDILLPCVLSDIGDEKSTTRQKILGKTLDYIHEHFSRPISLAMLAQVASTSVRNLQIVFKQELGISPGSYIQQFRLHRFRHLLAHASSVTEAAYASGFKHLGRLTERYARVFNHNPSVHLAMGIRERIEAGAPLVRGVLD